MPGPVAPRVAGWQQRLRNLPGPLLGASLVLGVPLLPAALGAGARMVVEIAWGAVLSNPASSWTWYDVTADVRQANGRTVSITVGRDAETSQASPATCAFELRNPDGAYTPSNPLGANWPNVVRNTPVRVRVTLDGGANWRVRFFGYANGFTPSWDNSARVAVVTVSASGITRRLTQGRTPLKSAIYRSVIDSNPGLYFTLGDGSSSSAAYSAVSGRVPYTFTGRVTFSSDAPAGGSGSADITSLLTSPSPYPVNPTFNAGGVGGSFYVACWVKGAVSNSSWSASLVTVNTPSSSTVAAWNVEITNPTGFGPVAVNALNSSGAAIFGWGGTGSGEVVNIADGNWHLVAFGVKQTGANTVTVYARVDNIESAFTGQTPYTLAPITGLRIGPIPTIGTTNITQMSMSNLIAWGTTTTPDIYNAGIGWAGETPQARMIRLCAEEGVPFETVGYYITDTTMGPQSTDTLINLLRECEATDAGFLYDGLSEQGGLSYQGISQRYDQNVSMTLDVPSGHLYDLNPADDDQRNRNLVTVTRKNGSTAVAQDASGPLGTAAVGTYDTQLTVNPVDDSRLAYRAGWEVHAGTIEGLRYPTLHPNLMRHAEVAQAWLNNSNGWGGAVLPGSRADVTNPSSVITQHPIGTVSLMLEGYAETISPFLWTVAGNCVPNRIYDVWKVADSQLGRVQTDSAYLTQDAAAGATTLTVASTGTIWTTTATNAGDFPLYVEVDGIQVTVTGISGTSSPQTFTVTGATVTKPLLAGKAVKVWHGGVIKF